MTEKYLKSRELAQLLGDLVPKNAVRFELILEANEIAVIKVTYPVDTLVGNKISALKKYRLVEKDER